MSNYKEMYYKLLHAHSKVLDILIRAGQEAEDLYVESDDVIRLMEERERRERKDPPEHREDGGI